MPSCYIYGTIDWRLKASRHQAEEARLIAKGLRPDSHKLSDVLARAMRCKYGYR